MQVIRASALLSACLLIHGISTQIAHAADVSLSAKGIKAVAKDDGTLHIYNEAGAERLVLGRYKVTWSPPTTSTGIAQVTQLPEGGQAIQTNYKVEGDASNRMRVQSLVVPSAYKLHLRYDIWASDGLNLAGSMLECRGVGRDKSGATIKSGTWIRDENGGVPYELAGRAGKLYHFPGEMAFVSLNGNMSWQDDFAMSFPPHKVEDGHYVAEGDIALSDFQARPDAAVALMTSKPLALDIWTDKPFSVWDDARYPLELHVQTVNVSDSAQSHILNWWARDFNGHILSEGNFRNTLKSHQVRDQLLSIPPPQRGIVFVEVEAKSGDFSVFKRTNLAVIPPYNFKSGPESLFGIAAYFPQPSEDAALAMLQRIGVRWLRGGSQIPTQYPHFGIRQNYAAGVQPEDETYKNSPAKMRDWLKQNLKIADENGADYWEISNEWNMSGGIGKAKYAEEYAKEVLTAADEMRDQNKARVKIMSQGLAGTDTAFIDKIFQAGAWNRFDALAIHTGRGNYTPDYVGQSTNGGYEYWNFLGSIREARKKLAQYGNKPLFVTEAYACTLPNITWYDTYRHAAENVVLSYALAASENVKVMNWYQFNDSTWFNVGGFDSDDAEYSYGLVNRDLSPKPSLLAYRTIAEALDEAKFTRWIKFDDPNVHGLLFSSARGPVTILWSRADGYVLNTNHKQVSKRFLAPEAWVDDWKTKTSISLIALGKEVQEIDCIGQQNMREVTSGRVHIILDGAPRIFYGLSPNNGEGGS